MAEARFKASQTAALEVLGRKGSADKVSTKKVDRPSKQGEKINTPSAGRPKGPDLKMLSLGLEPALVARIDEWRFKNKQTSRADAIRALLEEGLK